MIKNEKSPAWKPIEVKFAKLNLGKMETPLLLEVWDWNSMSAHDLMGQVTPRRALIPCGCAMPCTRLGLMELQPARVHAQR